MSKTLLERGLPAKLLLVLERFADCTGLFAGKPRPNNESLVTNNKKIAEISARFFYCLSFVRSLSNQIQKFKEHPRHENRSLPCATGASEDAGVWRVFLPVADDGAVPAVLPEYQWQ